MASASWIGKRRRLSRILNRTTGKTLIVPIDDSLIFGPFGGLADVPSKLADIISGSPDALLAYRGVFQNLPDLTETMGRIINLTASTTRSLHTRKVPTGQVSDAAAMDADAVAVHVNVSSSYEHEMITTLGRIIVDSESYGMPVLAIMYPRKEGQAGDYNYEDLRETQPNEYASLVAHCVRIAADLGADIIKTQFTGTAASFEKVVKACWPTPVVIAGGPVVTNDILMGNAYEAIQAGAAGISFGRNVFDRDQSWRYVQALRHIVHARGSIREGLEILEKASRPDTEGRAKNERPSQER